MNLSGYAREIRLSLARPRLGGELAHRIDARILTYTDSLSFQVDRALYSNTPKSPIWVEYWPEDLRVPILIREVYLYFLEEAWGLLLLRMIN